MNNLLNTVNTSPQLQQLFGVHGIAVKVRRIFMIDGTEITDINMLGQDEQLFLSEGQSFLPVSFILSFRVGNFFKLVTLMISKLSHPEILTTEAHPEPEKLSSPSEISMRRNFRKPGLNNLCAACTRCCVVI